MIAPSYRLLETFAGTFRGKPYHHRRSTQGDFIAIHLYEDIYRLGISTKLKERIESRRCVLNLANTLQGIASRRGDGTFGEAIPHMDVVMEGGFSVARGRLATVEIGAEVKIVSKAMVKQVDRVESDLRRQVDHFRKAGGNPITVAIVGINHAEQYTSYEGERAFTTDGKKYKHPAQEAAKAQEYLERKAKPDFDEFLILHFKVSNVQPFPFEWVNDQKTLADYGAILTRISRKYDSRF